ncbi:hypothetical protein ACFL0F_02075 [Patescibacteria group bacterium]
MEDKDNLETDSSNASASYSATGAEPRQPSTHTSNIEPKSSKKIAFIFFSFLIIAFFSGLGYLGYFYYQKRVRDIDPSTTKTPKEVQNKDEGFNQITNLETEGSWKKFQVYKVGLVFELPKEIYSLGNYREVETALNSPFESGKRLAAFINFKDAFEGKPLYDDVYSIFAIRGSSHDFGAERGPSFEEYNQGFIKEGEEFYIKTKFHRPEDRKIHVPKDIAELITNPNGVEILKIRCEIAGPSESLPPFYGHFDGFYGIINLPNNDTYPSLVVEMSTKSIANKEMFDRIISTIDFPKPKIDKEEAEKIVMALPETQNLLAYNPNYRVQVEDFDAIKEHWSVWLYLPRENTISTYDRFYVNQNTKQITRESEIVN